LQALTGGQSEVTIDPRATAATADRIEKTDRVTQRQRWRRRFPERRRRRWQNILWAAQVSMRDGMKKLCLLGSASLGLAALDTATNATPIDFTFTGTVVVFTISTTGIYQILPSRRAQAP
jgi:hypothetical protein